MTAIFVAGYREYSRLAHASIRRTDLVEGYSGRCGRDSSREVESLESRLPLPGHGRIDRASLCGAIRDCLGHHEFVSLSGRPAERLYRKPLHRVYQRLLLRLRWASSRQFQP